MRQHQGDRLYRPGDVREAPPADVVHLVRAGVLRIEQKAEPAPLNKAEGPAPRNKRSRP